MSLFKETQIYVTNLQNSDPTCGEISSDLYRTKKLKSKLNSSDTLTTVGDMNWFSTPIDETKHGNSYFDSPKYFWDFQILSVTL